MRRREFITLLGGAAAWPLAARAQPSRMPFVGVLRPNPKDIIETFAEPFRRYMKAIGWEEGRNIRFCLGRGPQRASARAGRGTHRPECRSHYHLRGPRHPSCATRDQGHPDRRHDRRHDRQRARGQLGATWRQHDRG